MTKDEKLKDGKMPHVIGPSASGHYRFQASMDLETARKVSKTLTTLKERFASSTMSAAFCDAIEALKELWQLRSRREHALKIANQQVVNPKENLTLWTDDDLILLIEDLTAQIENIKKALRGWPTTIATKFVDMDSNEYGEWEQENA